MNPNQEAGKQARRPITPYPVALTRSKEERVTRVEWLNKQANPEAKVLADKLATCHPVKRCGSGACPVCGTKAQQRLARAIYDQTRKSEGAAFTLTVVPELSIEAPGRLFGSDHENHVRRLKAALEKVDVDWLAGGTDFSLNEDLEGGFDPFWCPHLFGLGAAKNLELVRRQLGMRFASTERIRRPVRLQVWDGAKNAPLYALKTEFHRRVSLPPANKLNFQTGQPRSSRNTSNQRLRNAELLLHLDRIGTPKRIFTLRCQAHIGKHSSSLRLVA